MREIRGRSMAGQFLLAKPTYPQQIFETKSDLKLKKELADLKKVIYCRPQSNYHQVYHFYQPTSFPQIYEEKEKQPLEVWVNGEVNRSPYAEDKWKLGDDVSLLEMSQNYSSSSSSSYPSPIKQFQNIQLPQRKIKISDYLQQMRKEAIRTLASQASPQGPQQ